MASLSDTYQSSFLNRQKWSKSLGRKARALEGRKTRALAKLTPARAHNRARGSFWSGKERGACLGEADKGAALVQHQPAFCDRVIEAGFVLGRGAV